MFNRQEIAGPSDAVNFGRVVEFAEDGSIVIESDDTEYVYKFDDKSNRYTLESQDVMTEKSTISWRTNMSMMLQLLAVGAPEVGTVFVAGAGQLGQRITNDSPSFGSSVSINPFDKILAVGAPDVGKVFIYEL